MKIDDVAVSRSILRDYSSRFDGAMESDVLIAGGGPSGLVAAARLAAEEFRVVVLEKRLAPGGGVWGGGMLMNTIVVQPEAEHLLADLGVRCEVNEAGLLVAQSVELASALILKAVQAGATILNAITVQDVMVTDEQVAGLVANFSPVDVTHLHVDPLSFRARALLDATGHDADVLRTIERKVADAQFDTPTGQIAGESSMNASKAEGHIVELTKEVYPGVIVAGMAANAAAGAPRMGAIFGGMFLSGQRAARLAIEILEGE